MCVWQAVFALDTSTTGVAKKKLVQQVTASFTKNPIVRFSAHDFEAAFPGDTVDFNRYVDFVRRNLSQSEGTYKMVEDSIESMCWDQCKDFYNIGQFELGENYMKHLWQIYNRLCDPGTVPPNMDQEEANWLGEKISAHLGQHWSSSNVPNNMCYLELMQTMALKSFNKAATQAVENAVDNLYDWLVREVSMTGWLYKRTRKQANWTSWLRRWFVLTPGQLAYFDNQRQDKKRGEVLVNAHSRLEELPEFKSLARRFPARFKLTNSPYIEMEMSASDEHERKAWMSALLEIVDAAKTGTTPVQAILKERMTQKKGGSKMSIEQATSRLKSVRLRDGTGKTPEPAPPKKAKAPIPQKLPMAAEDENVRNQINKIQDVFRKVDKDRNGAIDAEEFRIFIRDMGLNITDKEITKIFNNIEVSNDGIITLDEFTEYFLNNILDETGSKSSDAEGRLRAAFLRADRDGTGTVDFREFAEYLWEKRRSMRMSKVMKAFDQMGEGKGEVSFDQFKNFFSNQRSSLAVISEDAEEEPETLEGRLRNMYNEADAKRMASFLRDRWEAFASFRRAGDSGDVVMTGGHGMVADVLPGNYNLIDLACFSDLPPITPRHIVVNDFKWIHAESGGHGKAIFPPEFSGTLPVEIATTEHLRYYGASLADSTQVQVSLMYRHGIQDFTYENKYLDDYVKATNGGSGIEMHDFSHLDCPLEEDSGYFIMAKIVNDNSMHLTAFKVPVRHTLYLPGGVIHSNDYLAGTWRTMLSDETEIDHVHIMKRRRRNNDFDLEHFAFTFDK